MQVSEQGNPALDHREGLGDDNGAPPQSRCPMPLLAVVAFQGDRLALALKKAADGQNQRIDAIAVGAEQTHLPAGEALEQPPEGPLVTVAAFPVDEPSGRAVVSLPDPDLVVLALQEVPHLIEFDHHRLARRRPGAAAIDIAAHPAQHRLRRGAEQVGHGVERQAIAVQADSGAFGRFRSAVTFKARELIAAAFPAPPLLASDDAIPDQSTTAALWTARKIGDHQNAKL